MGVAVAFTGISNSGKTTIIEKISKMLNSAGKRVAIVKHDPKDKAEFDTIGRENGKDSYKFFQTGASVAILSPNKSTILSHSGHVAEDLDLARLLDIFGVDIDRDIEHPKAIDYLIVEGLKEVRLPRICVIRDVLDERYFSYADSFAIDFGIRDRIDCDEGKDILDLNNPDEIIGWIDKNGARF